MSATMRLYTTPEYTLHVIGIDISSYSVYVTFRQENTVVTVNSGITKQYDSENEETKIIVSLTQVQTSGFKLKKPIYVQVNWMNNGDRKATNIAELPPLMNLLEEVIS